ncbi:IFN protein, partial [Halcyon senegalensis]|nr:IFN protein [Halcyon senegalensis]
TRTPTMPAPHTPQTHGARTLLLLLTALATALACHHLPPRHDTFLWDSIRLLHDMAPTPAQPCHHHQPTSRFPDTLLQTHHPQQAAATALRILQHLFAILSSPSTPQRWDDRARQQLLNGLQHHVQQLQHCLPPNATLAQGQGPRNRLLSINRYFAHIQDFLRTHNHSACAWEHVRLRARACFRDVDTLLRQMK